MRFLADENVDIPLVDALIRDGHDVERVTSSSPERTDAQVLARAIAEDRTLITQNTDFGQLAFTRVAPPTAA